MSRRALLSAILLALTAHLAVAQDTETWYRVTPEGEEFTVLMPDIPFRVRREITVAGNEPLTPPVYEIGVRRVLYSVLSFDKNQPGTPKTLAAFTEGFSKAVWRSGVASDNLLTFDRDLKLNGQTIKQYLLHAEGTTGTARLYETNKHYYVVMTIGAKAGVPSADNFFNSFMLKPVNVEALSNSVPLASGPNSLTQPMPVASQSTPPKPLWPVARMSRVLGRTTADHEGSVQPITAGVLNGKAIAKPAPAYPPIARAARASGTVVVQIVVDEEGYVIEAHAVSGHPLLQAAALRAARQARFTPTLLSGEPVKVSGIISYNFILQ